MAFTVADMHPASFVNHLVEYQARNLASDDVGEQLVDADTQDITIHCFSKRMLARVVRVVHTARQFIDLGAPESGRADVRFIVVFTDFINNFDAQILGLAHLGTVHPVGDCLANRY